jgi:hypothetical protein
MPDIFGNPTLQEMTQSRQRAFQGQVGDIMANNMARAQTGEEKAGTGVGSFLGALGAKYFGTPYAETAEGQAMAAREAQLAGVMGADYNNQNSNVSTPDGGITTQSTPVSQIDATRAKAKAFMDYATQTNNPEAFKYALGLEQEAITLGKAQQEAQIKEDYVNTLPEDLKNLGRSANSDPTEIQKIIEERNKKDDTFRVLTKDEAVMQGLDSTVSWQVNEKTNEVDELNKGIKIENNLGSGQSLSVLQEEVDKKYAPIMLEWNGGKGSDTMAQLDSLKPVMDALSSNGGKPITGLAEGVLPDFMLAVLNPEALNSRELVEGVLQRNLRAVLGAQFTDNEGTRLIKRGYNAMLSPEVNAQRVSRLITQMTIAAEQQQAMADYAGKYGTLKGYEGRIPTMADFDNALDGAKVKGSESTSGYSTEVSSLLDEARGTK